MQFFFFKLGEIQEGEGGGVWICLKRSGRRHVLFRVTQELPFPLSLSLSFSSPHPQEYSACFGPLSSHPFNPSPASLVSFSWTPYLPRLLATNTFFLTVLFYSSQSDSVDPPLSPSLSLSPSLECFVDLLTSSTCPHPSWDRPWWFLLDDVNAQQKKKKKERKKKNHTLADAAHTCTHEP